MLSPCHTWALEWIYTLYLPECQGTPCSKQAPYLNFKWQQQDNSVEKVFFSASVNINIDFNDIAYIKQCPMFLYL